MQQMYDATEGDGQKQIMQKIYDGVNNVLERMDNAWKNTTMERLEKFPSKSM